MRIPGALTTVIPPTDEAASDDRPAAAEHESDRLGIEAMLLGENPRRQRLDRVVVEQRDGCLQDDRTVIQFGRHQMHRRARDSDAVFERLPLRLEAGKRRQQGGMDIQDAVREGRDQRGAHQPHETCEADQIDVSCAEQMDECGVVRVSVGILAGVDVDRLDARVAGATEPGDVGAVGDHHCNHRLEPAVRDGVDDRLQVRAAAGDQDGQPRKTRSGVLHEPST